MQIKQVCDCSQILYFTSTEHKTRIYSTPHFSILLILLKQIPVSAPHYISDTVELYKHYQLKMSGSF